MKIKIIFLVLGLGGMGGCENMVSVQEQVERNYTDAAGRIHAYPDDSNSEYLSESIGLYMEYLLLAEDEKNFFNQYELLKNHFIVQENDFHFIRWRLDENAATNALIDDIRIISALEKATETFCKAEYGELARKLSDGIAAVQIQDSYTVDFYDWSLALPAQRLTLSYVAGDATISAESFRLLENLEDGEVFFPEYYDTAIEQYSSGNEVHMIDQLLIALNREKRVKDSNVFSNWLKEEWAKNQTLYGRYDRKTLEPTVEYESLAVYYYLHAYFTALGETEMADAVGRHAKEIAADETLGQAHFFDFIHYQLLLQNL